MKEIRCGNCGSTIKIGDGEGVPFEKLPNGIHYLMPSVVRNDNLTEKKTDDRIKALKEAGIDVSKLQTLMQSDSKIKDIFSDENDPILNELGKGGFIRNPELFRRWICAQTFALIKNPYGWTYAVRKRYDTAYVFKQTKRELELLIKLERKGLKNKDVRFSFFTLDDMKNIFLELNAHNRLFNADPVNYYIRNATTYKALLNAVDSTRWYFCKRDFIPARWLNCFKGAGAYYTLQNIIRTHGLVLPECKDMTESINQVQHVFDEIVSYAPSQRRWDILMSLLMSSVQKTKFELKY